MTAKTRKITVITVGSEDYEPTTDELQTVIEQFMTLGQEAPVVALPFPYKARVLDVTASEGILASTGWLSDEDIVACSQSFIEAAKKGHATEDGWIYNDRADSIAAFRAELDKRMND